VSERRSAIIATFRLPARIEAVRRRHVPNAPLGVPPHVTILSPFVPAVVLDTSARRRLAGIAADHPAFDVQFDRATSFPDALYLVPGPAEPFVALTTAVCRAFPGYPPYGEPSFRPEDVVPHLTIAIGERAAFDPLIELVMPALPVAGRATTMTVLEEGPDGRWRTRWRIALRR
jgi:2'-5' RNA ligase